MTKQRLVGWEANFQGCFWSLFPGSLVCRVQLAQESDVALLLRAVLKEAVHQLGINEVSRLEVVKDTIAAVVGDPAEDGKTGDEDGVVVVSAGGLLAQPDKGGQASHCNQLLAHGLHTAQPGERSFGSAAAAGTVGKRRCLNLIIRGREILLLRTGCQLLFGEY